MDVCRKISQNFSPADVALPLWRGRRRVRRAGERAIEQAFASHAFDLR